MSSRILLREQPSRSLAILTDSHALIFGHGPSTAGTQSYGSSVQAGASRCMVEFSALDHVALADYRPLRTSNVHGTLGLINIRADVFICIISGAVGVANVRPGETVQKVLSVEFCW